MFRPPVLKLMKSVDKICSRFYYTRGFREVKDKTKKKGGKPTESFKTVQHVQSRREKYVSLLREDQLAFQLENRPDLRMCEENKVHGNAVRFTGPFCYKIDETT